MMAVQPVVTESNFNRVFIVDDDDLFRESLGLNLAEEGYEVVDFANGESALEFMMSGEEAEAVLQDWRMPGLDGLAVLRRMRECRIPTPVLLLHVLRVQISSAPTLTRGTREFRHKPAHIPTTC